MLNCFIYLAVIVGGAAVLALELLGTRVLAPFYGVSLYLWSALISVTLLALSVGYALGGRSADRQARLDRFSMFIGIAGIWVIIIPWLRPPVFAACEPLGLRPAVLLVATILFFPPLVFLGMISPYAIRLKAANLDVVGRTAGSLYAISTMASVASAIITGFFLIPNVGVSRLLFLTGFVLLATAVLGILVHRKAAARIAGVVLLLAAGVLMYKIAPAETDDPDNGLMAIRQSPYGEIRVIDLDEIRYLLIDGGTHTAIDPETWETRFAYVNILDITSGFFDKPGDMLLIGLGGGSVAKSFTRNGWRVDAVEIDRVVTGIAREYFGLFSGEANVSTMDGRQFLISNTKKYNLIIMDVFGSGSIPFHMVTSEAFAQLQSHLTTDGVLAINFESVGWHGPLARSLAATARQHFQQVVTLPIAEPPDQFGNMVLTAANRPMTLKESLPVPLERFSPEYDRVHAWDNRFEEDITGVPVLTDDFNPVDVWSERTSYEARKQYHALFHQVGLAW